MTLPEVPEGHHLIAVPGPDGPVPKVVKTLYRAGLYVVQHDTGTYSITHTPSGLSVGPHGYRRELAVKIADHMHREAGDAGADLSFGEKPSGDVLARMAAAFAPWT